MTIFQAIVLGLIQGLTEFLPISSSAHLTLAPWLFGWNDPGLAFDVALHVGTLFAVLWYFRTEWIAMISAAGGLMRRAGRAETPAQRRLGHLVIATIPAAVGGILLEDKAESVFRSPAIIGTTLILLGGILWAVDRYCRANRPIGAMGWSDALVIGLAQVCALVPGVSRSGSTMTAGRALGFDRDSAAVFSFLMSMPITAAAVVFKAPQVLRETGISAPLVAGVIASAVSGWLAISFLLRYVGRHSYGIFAIYRILLGMVVFGLLAARG